MSKKDKLGDFEEIVLLGVLKMRDNAYGLSVRNAVAEATKANSSIGAIYATLERLERKGYVKSWEADPTPERGGRAKRYFEVTGAGLKALNDMREIRAELFSDWDGLETLGGC